MPLQHVPPMDGVEGSAFGGRVCKQGVVIVRKRTSRIIARQNGLNEHPDESVVPISITCCWKRKRMSYLREYSRTIANSW
ncbi:MAG: hypothetical protein ACSLEN_04195 [Candidatus Malihini olakiniferum]